MSCLFQAQVLLKTVAHKKKSHLRSRSLLTGIKTFYQTSPFQAANWASDRIDMVLHTAIFFILAVGAVFHAVTQTLLAHALHHVVVVHVLVHVRVRAQKLAQADYKINRKNIVLYVHTGSETIKTKN